MIQDDRDMNHLADLVSAVSAPIFMRVLDKLVENLCPFDLTAGFVYPDEQRPILIHDGFRGHGTAEALSTYLKGTYLLDPVYQAASSGLPQGVYHVSDLAPDAYEESDYWNNSGVHPCISLNSGALAGEIVFIVPLKHSAICAYSVMRSAGSAPFEDAQFERLRYFSAPICAAIARHWRDYRAEIDDAANMTWTKRTDRMAMGFETFATDLLTNRERMVVKLLLQGHSVSSCAMTLGVADGTIKNHKKNVFVKLMISSQYELFSLFVQHVLRDERNQGIMLAGNR